MFDRKYIPASAALKLLLDAVPGPLPAEDIIIEAAVARTSACDVCSGEDLPGFARSTVDGFAVRAADTYGAKETLPAYINLMDEVFMGQRPAFEIKAGEAARIPTGGMLPAGADAVVMIEHAQIASDSLIEVLKPAAYGENVIQHDEDIKKGSLIVPRGHKVRPQDTGALAGIGITRLAVVRKPVVTLISTGDEIVPHSSPLAPGQVRDINSFTLAGLVSQEGGIPVKKGIISDDYAAIRHALESSLQDSDIILIIGGTSVGTRDMTARVISDIGGSELLFHGVAVKPGKPLIGGVIGSKPVLGLPGHPAAVAISFDIFVRPVIYRLLGVNTGRIFRNTVHAVMSKTVPSAAGREDHIRVQLEAGPDGYLAVPVPGKSGLITTLVKADGVVVVPDNRLGLDEGEKVIVNLF
jgi:molybdopterin molybdotransferase